MPIIFVDNPCLKAWVCEFVLFQKKTIKTHSSFYSYVVSLN